MILNGFFREKSILAVLQVLYSRLGKTFEVPLPGFKAIFSAGPESNRQILVTERDKFKWRIEGDPVAGLLHEGVLVVDGDQHDRYRHLMEPALSPGQLQNYTARIIYQVDRVTATWQPGQTVDMLVECRKMALLIITDVLFGVDIWTDLSRIWEPVLKAIEYISPGPWIVFRRLPRPGFRNPLRILGDTLLGIIHSRQIAPTRDDLLGHLIAAGLTDSQIRDQMLTMLIAGHDTSTALLAWVCFLLGKNPDIYNRLQGDLDKALESGFPTTPSGWQPPLLDAVIKETLRLYPPIHLGNRWTREEVTLNGATIPAGRRVLYSIFLTHRDADIWKNPDQFDPDRFIAGPKYPPFSFVPFGGGPRACIGSAFGLAEVRLVLARLLNNYHFELLDQTIRAHMGATLEPRPGVLMKVTPNRPGRSIQ